jgi:pyruvate/2-oxoglutarate dehydrogenase complex dihydrolipoamide acyltransferase (E2) component
MVAIIGIGRISEKPIVRDGETVVVPVFALSLSFGHRIIRQITLNIYSTIQNYY